MGTPKAIKQIGKKIRSYVKKQMAMKPSKPFVWEKEQCITSQNSKIKRCCIFASYNKEGKIPDYVINYLKGLKEVADTIIFIADNQISNKDEIKKIENLVSYAEFGRHNCYDFGSWKKGLEYLSKTNNLCKYDEIILANDSCYGPVGSFGSIFNTMDAKTCDFWGLLDSQDSEYHLLSFFLVFKRNVFTDRLFLNFFHRIPTTLSFEEAVFEYERKLTTVLRTKYKADVFLPGFCSNSRSFYAGNRNPTVWPLSLLKAGFPLVKVKALTGQFGLDQKESRADTLSYLNKHFPVLHKVILTDLKRRGIDCNYLDFDNLSKDATKAIELHDVVSFDIFDTLLIRPFVSPIDTFNYIEKKFKAKGFAQERIRAERLVRKRSNEEDITLDEIYQNIHLKFQNFKSIELETEFGTLHANPAVKHIFNAAVSAGKKIICVSDMYLPKDFLRSVLNKNGFVKVDDIFVSSEYKKTKGSGNLYRIALRELNRKPSELVHFGDNLVADVEIPRRLGIQAYGVTRIAEKYLNSPANSACMCAWMERQNLSMSIHMSLVSQYMANESLEITYWEKLGYVYGGPLALSYVNFISQIAQESKLDKLLFISRDGYVLEKVYEKFFLNQVKIKHDYAYISRSIGLKATLDYANDEGYLKTLLSMAKKDLPYISISESFDDNKKTYELLKQDLEDWSKPSREVFYKHLDFKTSTSQRIGIVDMTTGLFSSLRYAQMVLKDKDLIGFYTGAFRKNEDLTVETFSERQFTYQDDLALKLSEFLISSPEKRVSDLDDNGCPVYGDEIGIRSSIYPLVMNGIFKYCEDFVKQFGIDRKLFLTMDDWLVLSNNFIRHCNHIDMDYLSQIYDSPHIDNKLDARSFTQRVTDFRKS